MNRDIIDVDEFDSDDDDPVLIQPRPVVVKLEEGVGAGPHNPFSAFLRKRAIRSGVQPIGTPYMNWERKRSLDEGLRLGNQLHQLRYLYRKNRERPNRDARDATSARRLYRQIELLLRRLGKPVPAEPVDDAFLEYPPGSTGDEQDVWEAAHQDQLNKDPNGLAPFRSLNPRFFFRAPEVPRESMLAPLAVEEPAPLAQVEEPSVDAVADAGVQPEEPIAPTMEVAPPWDMAPERHVHFEDPFALDRPEPLARDPDMENVLPEPRADPEDDGIGSLGLSSQRTSEPTPRAQTPPPNERQAMSALKRRKTDPERKAYRKKWIAERKDLHLSLNTFDADGNPDPGNMTDEQAEKRAQREWETMKNKLLRHKKAGSIPWSVDTEFAEKTGLIPGPDTKRGPGKGGSAGKKKKRPRPTAHAGVQTELELPDTNPGPGPGPETQADDEFEFSLGL